MEKYALNNFKKQREFTKRKDFKEIVKKELNYSILKGIYPIVNEFSAINLLRNKLTTEKTKRVLTKKLINFLERKSFFTNIYNFGSYFLLNNNYEAGVSLLEFLISFEDYLLNDIAGKAHYKIADIESNLEKKIYHLRECLKIMPYHKKASEELKKAKKEEK